MHGSRVSKTTLAHPVGAEEHGAEEASVDGGLVHHEGVLLVVAAVAGNGHNCVLASWELPVPGHAHIT